MSPFLNYRVCRVFSAGWMALIFFLSSLTPSDTPFPFVGADKVIHFAVYFVLGVFFAHSFRPGRSKPWRRLLTVSLMVSVYGAFDEFHQSFVPGRVPSVADLAADSAGGLAAAAVFRKWSLAPL